MVNRVSPYSSIFTGKWEESQGPNGTHVLTRTVKIGGKTYRMKVGYRPESSDPSDKSGQAAELIKKVIEDSDKEIKGFLKANFRKRGKRMLKFRADLAGGARAYSSRHEIDVTKRQHAAHLKLIDTLSWGYRKRKLLFPHQKFKPIAGLERLDTKSLGCNYAQRALDLIGKLKSLGKEGEVEIEGAKYFIPATDQYGRRNWELQIDGRYYEINEYEKNAYNGVQTEDFLKRQDLIYQAALLYLKKNKPAKEKTLLKALLRLNEDCSKDLKSSRFHIDWKKIHRNEDISQQYVEINLLATDRMAQFAKDIQHLISQAPGCEKFSIADLDSLEREHVLERGRPVILNTFEFSGQRFLHMHFPEAKDYEGVSSPQDKKTIPSTIRDKPGLANYVTSYGGVISPDGKVEITYEAMRHTSYSPIRIGSEIQRQIMAAENVRQGLKDLAFKMLQMKPAETSPENPLVIPLRTMVLLTPIVGDFLRNRTHFICGEWTGEGEALQLKESIFALRTFHGRTIPLQFGKDIVWVKPDLSMMNLGANAEAAGFGFFGKMPQDSFQKKVNARGFVEFVDEVEQYLREADLPDLARKVLSELEAVDQGSQELALARANLERVVSVCEEELNISCHELEALYAAYKARRTLSTAFKIKLKSRKIQRIENRIYRAHLKLVKLMRRDYLKNCLIYAQKQKELNNQFLELILTEADPSKKQAVERIRDIANNLHSAKKLFYEGKTSRPETVMEFQAIYIQTHSMINNFVEFFCKSGEDRTGRVDDKALEREVFKKVFRRVPATDEDYMVVKEILALIVHQYSVSQNTTEQNSNARGEQISYKVNPEVPAKLDAMQATLAKRVIKRAKKLKASANALLAIDSAELSGTHPACA